jgi:hypothetical protein
VSGRIVGVDGSDAGAALAGAVDAARVRPLTRFRSEGLEEGRERSQDPERDEHRGGDQDRSHRRVLPPPESVKDRPRGEVRDDREDRLPGKRPNVLVELEEVVDARACLAERRQEPVDERDDPGREHFRGDGTGRPIDFLDSGCVDGFVHDPPR